MGHNLRFITIIMAMLLPVARGNQPVDFSYAGYGKGIVQRPGVPVAIRLAPTNGDNTARIQAALDAASALPLNAAGIRGAVLLGRVPTVSEDNCESRRREWYCVARLPLFVRPANHDGR